MTRPHHRRPGAAARRLGAVAAAVLLAVGLAVPAAAAPAQDAPGVPSIQVAAQGLEVDADGDFPVFLNVTDAPPGSQVVVQIHNRIQDPASLAASATDEPGPRLATFDPLDLPERTTAEQGLNFTIHLYGPDDDRPTDVPANWVYQLDEPGVYPVKVRLLGPDEADLTSVTTYLVRRPEGDVTVAPADVALVATVHEAPPPAEAPAGTDPADLEAVDPELRRAVDDLLTAFAQRPELPASFQVTPDTAARLEADPDGLDTLDALRTELGRSGRELTGAPYVDLDPAGLVAAGLTDEVIRQHDLGRRTLATTFDRPETGWPGSDTWVLDRPIDAAGVEALADLGLAHLVLPADAVVGSPSTRYPLPGAAGRTDAITLAPDDLASGSPVDPILAGYQLLGRLAALASINPGGSVVALRIDPQAVDPAELATVLDGLAAGSTYVRATTLSQAFAETPVAPAAPPLAASADPPLGAYPNLVNQTQQLLTSYASMVPDQPERVLAFEQPLARSASVDLEITDRRSRVRRQQEILERRFDAVTVPERDRVTLGARDAQFPLPVTSTLSGPVKVVVTLEASDRLSFPQDRIEVTLTDERTVVPVRVRTRATGDTPLRITVRSPDGGRVLATSQYTVRSTAVSGVGLLLTVGAAAFLALWWGRHWWRSRHAEAPGKHARHGDAPDAPDTAADAADDDDLFVTSGAVTDPGSAADVTPTEDAGSEPD